MTGILRAVFGTLPAVACLACVTFADIDPPSPSTAVLPVRVVGGSWREGEGETGEDRLEIHIRLRSPERVPLQYLTDPSTPAAEAFSRAGPVAPLVTVRRPQAGQEAAPFTAEFVARGLILGAVDTVAPGQVRQVTATVDGARSELEHVLLDLAWYEVRADTVRLRTVEGVRLRRGRLVYPAAIAGGLALLIGFQLLTTP